MQIASIFDSKIQNFCDFLSWPRSHRERPGLLRKAESVSGSQHDYMLDLYLPFQYRFEEADCFHQSNLDSSSVDQHVSARGLRTLH